ncbi:transmembrane protein 177 [Eucyclogobius newberryi]|uniref:transmembrane protein 177 n=1 Tax=Eucyclogobius newberryi TaxID=166745 RepID=UPI003B5C1D57
MSCEFSKRDVGVLQRRPCPSETSVSLRDVGVLQRRPCPSETSVSLRDVGVLQRRRCPSETSVSFRDVRVPQRRRCPSETSVSLRRRCPSETSVSFRDVRVPQRRPCPSETSVSLRDVRVPQRRRCPSETSVSLRDVGVPQRRRCPSETSVSFRDVRVPQRRRCPSETSVSLRDVGVLQRRRCPSETETSVSFRDRDVRVPQRRRCPSETETSVSFRDRDVRVPQRRPCPSETMASGWLRASLLLQKYRSPLFITTCSGLFGLNLVQHLVPDQSFCALYQAWSRGEPVQLSDKLKNLFQQVLQDCGVGSPHKFSAFASFGFHPVGAGLPLLPSGVRVGIPANFNSSEDDLRGTTDRTIFINGRAVDWSSSSGSALRHALVLSEHAQKFAVAREVARLEGCLPLLSAAVAPVSVGGVWVYSVVLKQVFSLHGGPLLLRAAANALSLAIGAVTYFLASDAAGQFVDYSSDRRAAAVSPHYAHGGVEFYNKLLSRNRTLRALMGPKGEEMYAANGNLFPSNLLQLKHAPYTARRDGIQALITE